MSDKKVDVYHKLVIALPLSIHFFFIFSPLGPFQELIRTLLLLYLNTLAFYTWYMLFSCSTGSEPFITTRITLFARKITKADGDNHALTQPLQEEKGPFSVSLTY